MLLQPYWAWRLRALWCRGGDGDGLFAPLWGRSHGLEALGSGLGVFPDGTAGPGPARAPVPRDLLSHGVSTGGTHCPQQRGAGTGVAEGHEPACVPQPGQGSRTRPLAPFQPHKRLLSVAEAPPGPPSGPRCGAGPAGGERSQPENEKSPPALGSAAPAQALVHRGRGKPEPRDRTAMSLPLPPPGGAARAGADPAGRAGGAGRARAGTSVPPGFLRLGSTQRSVGPPQAKFQPRFEDGSLSVLVPSPLPCVFPAGGVWAGETTRAAGPLARDCPFTREEP